MTIRRQFTGGDGRRGARLRRDRLDARCLMGVPQAHVAIIGCRDDHGRVERDVQGGDGLWVRQKLLYHFVLSDVPDEQEVIRTRGK